jgi:hypothetical protein
MMCTDHGGLMRPSIYSDFWGTLSALEEENTERRTAGALRRKTVRAVPADAVTVVKAQGERLNGISVKPTGSSRRCTHIAEEADDLVTRSAASGDCGQLGVAMELRLLEHR